MFTIRRDPHIDTIHRRLGQPIDNIRRGGIDEVGLIELQLGGGKLLVARRRSETEYGRSTLMVESSNLRRPVHKAPPIHQWQEAGSHQQDDLERDRPR